MRVAEVPRREQLHHQYADPHREGSSLSDVILGGQDGLVNVLGVILGVAAATEDARVVLVAGFAATLAESISMAGVAYTSTVAKGELYESERAREYRHLRDAPNLERDEVRQIYQRKGFDGRVLDQIVDTITANPDVWVAVMMAEEHQLTPIDRKAALRSSFVVGASAIVGSLIPLVPFIAVPVNMGMLLAIGLSAVALFVVGAVKARRTVGRPARSGFELMMIGIVSAMVGWAVGYASKLW
jgi:vacuolar iron transporter family protein